MNPATLRSGAAAPGRALASPAAPCGGARSLPRPLGFRASFLLGLLSLAPRAGAAEAPKPWVPQGADSLIRQTAEAKVRFQTNQGDSIGGANFRAYEIVGNAARRLLRGMGRENMIQARAVEAVLDSLGLDTDMVLDPELPYFALLMVRNPYKLESKSVGFLYWYKGRELRMQGAQFSGGQRPQSRVWWTNNENAPYAWGVADFARKDGDMHFTLFRLTPTGNYWSVAQYEDSGYRLGSGAAAWVDMNGDQRPELVAWMPGERDSLFEGCEDCPKPIAELLFAERGGGFALQDTRIVPSPYSTFERFVRLLADGNRAQAARLLEDPAMIDKAIAAGWTTRRPRAWKVEYAEPGTSWPAWMMVTFRGAPRPHRYTVRFELVRGRWLIHEWIEREIVPPGTAGKVSPAAGRTSPDAGKRSPATGKASPAAGKASRPGPAVKDSLPGAGGK